MKVIFTTAVSRGTHGRAVMINIAVRFLASR